MKLGIICEKPITTNDNELSRLIEISNKKKLFFQSQIFYCNLNLLTSVLRFSAIC